MNFRFYNILIGLFCSIICNGQTTKETLNAILFDRDDIYCYYDTAITTSTKYSFKKFNQLLDEGKRKHGDKFAVIFKPTVDCPFEAMVEVIGHTNKVKKIKATLGPLEDNEMSYFKTRSFADPEPIVVQEPKTVVELKPPASPRLVILMPSDTKIIFNYIDTLLAINETIELINSDSVQVFTNLDTLFKKNQIDASKVRVYIYGNETVSYTPFDRLIDALKRKDIYKYELGIIPEK